MYEASRLTRFGGFRDLTQGGEGAGIADFDAYDGWEAIGWGRCTPSIRKDKYCNPIVS